jgi:hypothetical protein
MFEFIILNFFVNAQRRIAVVLDGSSSPQRRLIMLVPNTRSLCAKELERIRRKARSECDLIVYGVGKVVLNLIFSNSSKSMLVNLLQLPFVMVPQLSNARSDGWLLDSILFGVITSKHSLFAVVKSFFMLLISM